MVEYLKDSSLTISRLWLAQGYYELSIVSFKNIQLFSHSETIQIDLDRHNSDCLAGSFSVACN